MKRIHVACWLLMIGIVAGCSGLKTYRETGERNLLVRTTLSGSPFNRVRAYLHIYDKDDCEHNYLGSFKLKNGEKQIAMETGRPLYIDFVFAASAFIHNRSILTFQPGVRYIADISYVNRIYNVTMHEVGPNGKPGRQVQGDPWRCPDF